MSGMNRQDLWDKGDRLIFKIAMEYTRKGYFVIPNYGHSQGVDVTIITTKTGNIKAVVECKNYDKRNFVCDATFKKDLEGLNLFDALPGVEKIMIVSYSEIFSDDKKKILQENNIKLRVIGYEP